MFVGQFLGRSNVLFWQEEAGEIVELAESVRHLNHSAQNWQRGRPFWGSNGIVVSKFGAVTRYTGEIFDSRCLVICPDDTDLLPAITHFALSGALWRELSKFDKSFAIGSPKTLMDIPFDSEEWRQLAAEEYAEGLPEPYSDDPTQWLFHGHPAHTEQGTELHVGLARLLGYRWPAESDSDMRLSEHARALIAKSKELDGNGFTDADGIVCLSPVRGEPSAAARLRGLMAAAFGSSWTTDSERELLESTASAGHGRGTPARSLDGWLRKDFFEEHCRVFQQRPFIWHVWDGLKDGFNALINYHRLAGPDSQGRRTLEALTYTYLGEWIDRQRQAQKDGAEGADTKLAAALQLQGELERILEGEPPYDIFVRWKPLHEQPLGWDPDLDDGVQINIRPFLLANDVGRKGSGILRWRPNCKWTPDAGKEAGTLRPRENFPWFWGCQPKSKPHHRLDFGADTLDAVPAGEEFTGKRWNELHYSRAAKQAARQARTAGERT